MIQREIEFSKILKISFEEAKDQGCQSIGTNSIIGQIQCF